MTAEFPDDERPRKSVAMDTLDKLDRALKVWAVLGPLIFGAGGWFIADARAQAKTGEDVAALLRRVGTAEGDIVKVRDELWRVRTDTLVQLQVQLQERKVQADALDIMVRKELLRRSEPTVNAAGTK